ncbi:MAG: transposase [Anaerolineales bacterium]|nr:transposase [Anaerolineales bacterium]
MIPLKPGVFFHIFNRGINRSRIFFEERNYAYFLALHERFLPPLSDTYAFCLLPNHFHFLIKVKPGEEPVSALISKAFNRLFASYALAINKAYSRTGSLFQHHFHRIPVGSSRYFAALVHYIHRNPQTHGLVPDFRDWPYSSYHILLSQKPTRIQRASTLSRFGGRTGFLEYHRRPRPCEGLSDFIGNDMD